MDIGSRIKSARNDSGLTQEAAAEALSVSRQTISNWENEKSYPDIVSVIRMSDLYKVSLDYLLKGQTVKGESDMSYIDYLDESTNLIKSKQKQGKLLITISYLLIWSISVIVFWFFTSGSDAMGYSLLFLWGVIPITTFVLSILIGRFNYWGKYKWISAVFFGIAYCLIEYLTFSMSNMNAFGHFNSPRWSMIAAGAVISLIGLAIGHIIYLKKRVKDDIKK